MKIKTLQLKRALGVALFVLLLSVMGLTKAAANDLQSYVITASANPTVGGYVSGAGTYDEGISCTLNANPRTGYTFVCWTKNGDVVSANTSYTFTVSEDATYVARFLDLPPEIGVPIGSYNTSSYYLPCGSMGGYYLTQQIYTSDEIGGAGTINSIAFYNTLANTSRNCDFYLKPTAKTVFDNNTDWVAVTDEDRVYSGNVTYSADAWTVVNFDVPFEYDGTSNLLLVVHDYTQSYTMFGLPLSFQVTNTNGEQSLYIMDRSTNSGDSPFDPINPSNYDGTLFSGKNRIVFGGITNSGNYNVNVTINPANAGVVTGEGLYQWGSTCVLTATPNPYYHVESWTKNGVEISTDAWCAFPVVDDCQVEVNIVSNTIEFADANVKAICVANWDTNGDGELSYAEAAAVTDLGEVFRNNRTITSFDEFQYFTGVTSIADNAFLFCNSLTSITIPNTVVSIGEHALSWCRSLAQITIPSSVTSIGAYTFTCSGLTNITIPNSVCFIGNSAFAGCANLTSIILPNSINSIRNGTFTNCSSLPSIDIPDSVTSIGNDAFNGCHALTNFTIPNTVVSIGRQAFHGCSSLNTIVIPSSVSSIGTNPFTECTGLEQIIVESDNVYYDSREGCNAIVATESNCLITGCKNTVIPSTITSIGDEAFLACRGLTSISIPNTVSSIGWHAFTACSGLSSLVIPSSVIVIGEEAFSSCSGLEIISVEQGNPNYDSRFNCNAIIKTNTNALVVGCKNTIIPQNVASIGDGAFSDCIGLVTISIPISVTSIGSFAFHKCTGLASIAIPNSVTSIGWDAFSECNALTTIKLPELITAIDGFTFSNCNNLSSILIPSSVTTIGNNAFMYCTGMASMIVQASIPPTLGYNAFGEVDKSIPVYVPARTIEAYQSSDGWNEFFNFIELETIGVGDGTNTSFHVPFNSFYNFSFVEQLYPASEIGTAGTITAIGFNMASNNTQSNSVVVFMKHVTRSRFEDISDYESVSEEDIVFEGSWDVANGWPTIILDTPFEYDGTSNLLIAIDENKPGFGTREFYVTEADSCCLNYYSDGINPNPYMLESYGGSKALRSQRANLRVFINPVESETTYSVNALCVPNDGGSVAGAGIYEENSICSLSATPNVTNLFLYWSENGEIVSMENPYVFEVHSDRDLVANFCMRENHWIPITGNQYNMSVIGCIVINGEEQNNNIFEVGAFCGDECRGCAIAEFFPPTQQYVVSLTILSNESSGENITFRLFDRALDQERDDLICMNSLTFENQTIVGTMDDWYEFSFNSTRDVSAIVNPADAGTVMGQGQYVFGTQVTLEAIANEGFSFRNWVLDGEIVSSDNPYSFVATETLIFEAVFDYVQSQSFVEGWSWWSSWTDASGVEGLEMLENSLGNSGLYIISQNEITRNYYPSLGYNYWFGSLTGIEIGKGYKVNTSEPVDAIVIGNLVNPMDYPITITPGWNWIGYPLHVQQSPATVFANFYPMNNDAIVSQGAIATYYEGYGWFPQSFVMTPGNSYLYKSTSSVEKTLVFGNGRSSEAQESNWEDLRHWRNNIHDFAENINVIATIYVGDEEQCNDALEVGAFVDGECRGSARLLYFEPTNRYYALLTIAGEEGEQVEFRLIDTKTQQINTNCKSEIMFITNTITGNLDQPYPICFEDRNDDKYALVFPNPIDHNQSFTIKLPENEEVSELIITNALGTQVCHEMGDMDGLFMEGLSVSGIYLIKVYCKSGKVYYDKLIVK